MTRILSRILLAGLALTVLTTPVYAKREATLNIIGIKPEIEQQQLEGDLIAERKRGYNNISIRMKNKGDKFWRLSSHAIYKVEWDPETRHYTMDIKRVVRENEWMSFSKPLVVRVLAHTVNKNVFWTEMIRTADQLGDPIILDRYNMGEGKGETKPPMTKAERETWEAERKAQQEAYQARFNKPEKPEPAKPAPAPQSTPKKQEPAPEVTMTMDEAKKAFGSLMGAFGGGVKLNIAGIAPEVEARALKGDLILQKKGNFMLHARNESEAAYKPFMVNTKLKGKFKFDPKTKHYKLKVKAKLKEGAVSFDQPVVMLVTAETHFGNFFWTEVTRTRENLADPIVLDHYTGKAGEDEPLKTKK